MQQYNTRIQLKSDTEAKWRLIESTFRPLAGELIIYSADDTHSYCRAKIGDGSSNLASLPFIDAGTINGNEVEIVKCAGFSNLPSPGSPDKLYVDTTTNSIYHYDGASGYTQLSNFTLTVSKNGVTSAISNWSGGTATTASIENNTLKIINGLIPSLTYTNIQMIDNVTLTPNSQG